jgi:hypothetical protein
MKALAGVILLLSSAALGRQSEDQILRHWDYDKSVAEDIRHPGIQNRDGVTIYDISFASPMGQWTERNTSPAPAAMFLQYGSGEPFLKADLAKQYFEVVSEPKRLKIYDVPHALNAEATRDRIAFLAEQLSFRPPEAKAVRAIPALVQPPWPKGGQ